MAQEIIQDVPTPFHVYDEKGIRENAAASTRHSVGTKVASILPSRLCQTLSSCRSSRREGCGVDCSSPDWSWMLSEVCGFSWQ